jgi:hypothetical protein
MKEVLKYVCEHCKREYKVKINAKNHEIICWKNPKLKTCLTCVFFGGFDSMSDGSEFGREEYIVCKEFPDLPTDRTPLTNCGYWVHDERTKKQKREDELKKIVSELNETGLTF